MLKKFLIIIFTILASIALAGCAARRSEVLLPSISSNPTNLTETGKTVAIRSIVDSRAFEINSSNPSVESLGSGMVAQGEDVREIQTRALARISNGNNVAMGNVILQKGQTVELLMRENISSALQQAGYRVIPASSATHETLLLDIQIRRFWAWDSFGMMAKRVHGVIDTNIIRSDSRTPVTTHIHTTITRITGGHEDAIQQALNEYKDRLSNDLK